MTGGREEDVEGKIVLGFIMIAYEPLHCHGNVVTIGTMQYYYAHTCTCSHTCTCEHENTHFLPVISTDFYTTSGVLVAMAVNSEGKGC